MVENLGFKTEPSYKEPKVAIPQFAMEVLRVFLLRTGTWRERVE